MRKIKEVLRLHSLGLAQRQIARSCSIGQSTVSEYVKAAEAARLGWPEVADWDEARLIAALAPQCPAAPKPGRPAEPDFAAIHTELQQDRHLTLLLVWEEYRVAHPDGYRYSRFCELYQRWRRKQERVLRQAHRAGEKLFVDYAGRTIPVQDPASGETREAQLFVAVLGASNYTFAEATWTQTADSAGSAGTALPPAGLPAGLLAWRARLRAPQATTSARHSRRGSSSVGLFSDRGPGIATLRRHWPLLPAEAVSPSTRWRDSIPAARRQSPAVSRRTPVARRMRRGDHPSRPNSSAFLL